MFLCTYVVWELARPEMKVRAAEIQCYRDEIMRLHDEVTELGRRDAAMFCDKIAAEQWARHVEEVNTRLDNENAEARIYLANILYDRGDYEAALKRGRKALEEHRWVAEAVIAGNGDLASLLMAQHIRASRNSPSIRLIVLIRRDTSFFESLISKYCPPVLSAIDLRDFELSLVTTVLPSRSFLTPFPA